MKAVTKKIFILSASFLLVLVVALAVAKMAMPGQVKAAPEAALQEEAENQTVDTARLRLFQKVYASLDPNRKAFSISGTLSVEDGADSTTKTGNLPYNFIKRDSSFYYQLGVTETLNAGGLYIYIDHSLKKILVSAQKQIIPAGAMPDLNKLVTGIKEEGYHMAEAGAGTGQTKISLLNPNHVSCKEYSLVFNKETLMPSEFFSRLSNPEDPEDPKKDKTIRMRISRVEASADAGKLLPGRFIKSSGERSYVPVQAYQGYEVIVMM